MKKLLILASLLMLGISALAVASCGSVAREATGTKTDTPTPAPAAAPAPRGIRAAFSTDSSSLRLPSAARMIARTADLSIAADDIQAAVTTAESLAEEMGGYVVSSNRSGSEENERASITLRVPAERFGQAINRLRSMAVKVLSENVNAQDVTEEYIDLDARLRNLESTEKQYLSLLGQARTVTETLEVQRALSDVRSQIEQMKGRLQYLERTTATSLITVSLSPTLRAKPLVRPGWSPADTLGVAFRALVVTGQAVANLGIWLAIFSPLWIGLGVLLWYIRKRWLRPRK